MTDIKVFNKRQASVFKHGIYADSRVEAVFNCIPVSLESRLMLHTVVFLNIYLIIRKSFVLGVSKTIRGE